MQPLSGKVIVSTRPAIEEDLLHQRLEEEGAVVISIPMIEISDLSRDPDMIKILHDLKHFQWLVFTSSNGVKYFFDDLVSLGLSIPSGLKFAVYGNRTGSELNQKGHAADFLFHGGTSTDFHQAFHTQLKKQDQVLLVQGNLAPQYLEEELSKQALVQRINVYQTTPPKTIDPEKLQRIISRNYDYLLFTSPSGFINFKSMIPADFDLGQLKIISIGQRTAQAIIDNGAQSMLIAPTPDAEGIIHSIIQYDQNKKINKLK